MKKILIAVFTIVSITTNAQNVGIGTPNPLNKLHVAGGFRLDTLTGVNGAGLLKHDAGGVVYGLKFTGNINDVLRGDGSFGPSSGGAAGYWSTNGDNIYNNNIGFVGIGTQTPGSGLELRGTGLQTQQRITDITSGNSLVFQAGSDANLKVTGYNYGNGTAQPLYLSVDGANTIMNPNGGYVGIGTATPGSGFEIRGAGLGSQQRITDPVSGNSLVLQGGAGLGMKISAYNFSTNAAKPLYLSTDGGNTIINPTAGSAGIGRLAISPGYLLDVGGPVKSVDALSTHFVAQTTGGTNSWARYYMRSNEQSWFMGTSQNFNGNQLYIGDETYNQTRLSIQPNGGPINVQGNTTQNLGGFGLPKAMVFVNGDGTITRSYNGITGATGQESGITASKLRTGEYNVSFGFNIGNGFYSVSLVNNLADQKPVGISFEPSGDYLAIYIFETNEVGPLGEVKHTDRPFVIIVY